MAASALAGCPLRRWLATSTRRARRSRQRAGRVGLGLRQRAELELDRGGQLQVARIAGGGTQQLQRQFTRLAEVAATVGQLRLGVARARAVRGLRLQLVDLLRRVVELVAFHQQRGDGELGVGKTRLGLSGAAVGGQRIVGRRAGQTQQVALELPGLGMGGVARDDVVDDGERAARVAGGGKQPGLEHQRRRMAGHRQQRGFDGGGRRDGVAEHALGARQRRLQAGVGLRLAEAQAGKFLDDLAGLPVDQQGARQLRHHRIVGMAGGARLAQFDLRRGGVALAQQQAAEQETRLAVVRVGLQCILDLDRCRGDVVLFEQRTRLDQPRRRVLGAAAGEQRQRQCGGGDQEAWIQRHRVLRRRTWVTTGRGRSVSIVDTGTAGPSSRVCTRSAGVWRRRAQQ